MGRPHTTRARAQMRAAYAVVAKLHGYKKFRRGDRYIFINGLDDEAVDFILRNVTPVERAAEKTDTPEAVIRAWAAMGHLPALMVAEAPASASLPVGALLVSPLNVRRLAMLARCAEWLEGQGFTRDAARINRAPTSPGGTAWPG